MKGSRRQKLDTRRGLVCHENCSVVRYLSIHSAKLTPYLQSQYLRSLLSSGILYDILCKADLLTELILKKYQPTPTANKTHSCKRGKGESEVFRSPELAFLNHKTGCTLVASYDKPYML